jgi:hypothetical protein
MVEARQGARVSAAVAVGALVVYAAQCAPAEFRFAPSAAEGGVPDATTDAGPEREPHP